MATQDANAVATKWAQRLSGATQAITDGVNATTVAPGRAAAAAADKWLNNVMNAKDKFIRNVSAVSLQSWQQAMLTKGVSRVGSGATAAVPKMTAFMSQWLPYAAQGAQQVAAMPNVTIDDAIARAAAQIRWNAAFQRQPYNIA